ncbi:protein of unknown function [Prevotella sp. KH2C16]|nr:protein of unknown function [Prevotella sp. KH2C16]
MFLLGFYSSFIPFFSNFAHNYDKPDKMYFTGIIIATITFLIIGLFHPIVIKVEYYFGTRLWWVFLILGCLAIFAAFSIENVLVSALHGVFGASCLWSIGEIFEQKKRCERGWFPKNPKRKNYYKKPDEVKLWTDGENENETDSCR